ncbi:MAG: non-ribosomal peptide synthase, partial [Candidatus Dadabacteria bacterium]|nr:non-ribosomal peptide synthase [Candidatus Dadabacteria bacterium]
MDSQQFADLELKTIISLAGMPVQKDLVNPRKPLEMAKRVRVTFRPLPRNYGNQIVIKFREKLENKLKEHGVQVIPWDEAAELPAGLISKVLRTRKVKRNIHAVV